MYSRNLIIYLLFLITSLSSSAASLSITLHMNSLKLILNHDGISPEGERQEKISRAVVELGLKLYPVESEGVKEGGESLHQNCNKLSRILETPPTVTHHRNGPGSPGSEDCGQNEGPEIGVDKPSPHDHAPENLARNIFVTTEEMISYL